MIPATMLIQQLRNRARRTTSTLLKGALYRLVNDIKHAQVYAHGTEVESIASILDDRYRVCAFYSCLREQKTPHSTPTELGVYGSFGGPMNWTEYALMVSMIQECSDAQYEVAHIDPDTIVIPFPLMATLLVLTQATEREDERQQLDGVDRRLSLAFLFPHNVSPIQGLTALRRSVENDWGDNEQVFLPRQETVQ